MMRPQFREALQAQHNVLLALWWIFFAAIFLYLALARTFLADRQLALSASVADAARLIFWLLALADVATLVWWKKRFLTRAAILGGAKRYKVLQALQDHKTPLEERAAAAVSSYVTGKIVAFAMAEAVAIYGFALVLTSRYFSGQYILSAAAAVLLLLELPAKSFLAQLAEDVEAGAGAPPVEDRAGP